MEYLNVDLSTRCSSLGFIPLSLHCIKWCKILDIKVRKKIQENKHQRNDRAYLQQNIVLCKHVNEMQLSRSNYAQFYERKMSTVFLKEIKMHNTTVTETGLSL